LRLAFSLPSFKFTPLLFGKFRVFSLLARTVGGTRREKC
jgi:hypothetical protein